MIIDLPYVRQMVGIAPRARNPNILSVADRFMVEVPDLSEGEVSLGSTVHFGPRQSDTSRRTFWGEGCHWAYIDDMALTGVRYAEERAQAEMDRLFFKVLKGPKAEVADVFDDILKTDEGIRDVVEDYSHDNRAMAISTALETMRGFDGRPVIKVCEPVVSVSLPLEETNGIRTMFTPRTQLAGLRPPEAAMVFRFDQLDTLSEVFQGRDMALMDAENADGPYEVLFATEDAHALDSERLSAFNFLRWRADQAAMSTDTATVEFIDLWCDLREIVEADDRSDDGISRGLDIVQALDDRAPANKWAGARSTTALWLPILRTQWDSRPISMGDTYLTPPGYGR